VKRERDVLKSTQDYYDNIRNAMMLVPGPPALGAPTHALPALGAPTPAPAALDTTIAVAITANDATDINTFTTGGDEGGAPSADHAHNSSSAAGGVGGVGK